MKPCYGYHWSGSGIRGTHDSWMDDPSGSGIPVFSALEFAGLPGELLVRLKFGGEKHLASLAGGLMVRHIHTLPKQGELIVPVPVSRTRKLQRGYNQAALIASDLARRTGCSMRRMLRRDDTPSQVGLSIRQRRENVRGVFHVRSGREPQSGSRVWLVDDVATTFSTIHNAATALLEAGAERVLGLTLAYRRKTSGSIIPQAEA